MKKLFCTLLALFMLLSLAAAFSSCGGATKGLEYKLLSDGTYAVTGGAEGAKTVRIPAEYQGAPVTAIADRAFEYRDEIRAFHLPASVTKIGQHVFGYSDALATVTVAEGNPVYHSVDNCLIETASGTLILGGKKSKIPTDGSVTVIGVSAFLGRTTLTSISIPDGVTAIGNYAFAGCELLSSVNLPAGVTSIGDNVFAFCPSLTSVTIPVGVTGIGYGIFEGCEQEIEITYCGTVAEWKDSFGAWYLGASSLRVSCTDGVIEGSNSFGS